MNHRSIRAQGRLSLNEEEGEGEGEGLARTSTEIEPLTFILSPCRRGEAMAPNIVGLRK
jgi:hypothetical protein